MTAVEESLSGGRSTVGVVKVGSTVRRPTCARSPFVHLLLRHLQAKNFGGAPRLLGLDGGGREILSFMPGEVPAELGNFTHAQLIAAARLLRTLHDATEDCSLCTTGQVVCHGDPSPCNCVFQDGVPYAFIDFDNAYSGDRSEDVGYAAWLWLDIGNDEIEAGPQHQRIKDFVAAYGSSATFDPIEAILNAQRRLCDRVDGPQGNREWARACLDWTERHLK